jgi:hypothetical protein
MAAFTYTLVISGAVSTSAVFTPTVEELIPPVKSGTIVGSVVVEPVDWSGVLTVDAPFAMEGNKVVVGPTPLEADTYEISGRSTP